MQFFFNGKRLDMRAPQLLSKQLCQAGVKVLKTSLFKANVPQGISLTFI